MSLRGQISAKGVHLLPTRASARGRIGDWESFGQEAGQRSD